MKRFPFLLPVLLLAAPAFSAPVAWHSVAGSSVIEWTASWQGAPVKGRFQRFTVTGHLDAAHPAGGTLKLVVDTTSVSAASADVTRAIHGAQWFGVDHYPKARFQGTLQGHAGALTLKGTLTLKGHGKALAFPLTLSNEKGGIRMQGDFTLDRTDFGIGSGQWKSGSMIATEVHVHFSVLLARRASG